MADFDRLPYPIERQLQAVRSTLRTYVTMRSLLLIVLWLLILFWVGGLFDYLPVRVGASESPRWLRIALLASMCLGAFWILLRWLAPILLTTIPNRSLALLIERFAKNFNNELVTTVELTSKDQSDISNPALHRAMLERVREAASEKIAGIQTADLFNWQPVWALGTATSLGLIMTIVAAIGFPSWMGLWSKRLFTLADTPWPRAAELRADGVQLAFPSFSGQLSAERVMLPFENGLVHVPDGSTVMLQVSANANAKQVPELCTVHYRSTDGTRGRANLRRVGSPRNGWQQFTLDGAPFDGITETLQLSVVGMDARLRDLEVRVVESAVISNMQLQCVYPPYLLDALSSRPPQENLNYRAGLRIPEGTQVILAGRSNTILREVQYSFMQTDSASAANSADLSSFSPQIVKPNGNEFAIDLGVLRENRVIEIRLIDMFGLPSEQVMRYVVNIVEDSLPEVESTLAGIGSAVTPVAVLPVRGSVADDHRVDAVQLELAVNENDPQLIPLQVDQEGQLNSDIDLRKLTEAGWPIRPEVTLGLVVNASDRFDLDSEPHVGRGQPQQLAVVTQDQLLVLLDRQELELRQRLEQIIAELQQVDEALKSMDVSASSSEAAWLNSTVDILSQFTSSQPQSGTIQEPENGGGNEGLRRQDDEDEAARQRRMAVLRSQQSVLQCDKSEQELMGVASRVDNLRLQLVNNRIDSYDRQERLLTKVHDPLESLLETKYRELAARLAELQSATMSGEAREQLKASITALGEVLIELEQIKSNMIDIESFNEIVDLVRGLLEDQERILNQTQEKQKAGILDLLK